MNLEAFSKRHGLELSGGKGDLFTEGHGGGE